MHNLWSKEDDLVKENTDILFFLMVVCVPVSYLKMMVIIFKLCDPLEEVSWQ